LDLATRFERECDAASVPFVEPLKAMNELRRRYAYDDEVTTEGAAPGSDSVDAGIVL